MRLLRLALLITCLSGGSNASAQNPAALQQALQQAVAAVDPSVVRIETVGGADLVGETLTGTGPTSGCVIREDGLILTSRFNFLSNPSSVIVTLADERKFPAEIVANDESRMLTLLKIPATGLVPVQPAAPEQVRVGQWAIAVGRTFDLKFPNATVGIVSALNRVWGRALQTDAKTSPLNYGGPLIDIHGKCLGILVPLSPDERGTTAGVEWYDSGIGFAVPVTDLEQALPRLIAGETLKPGLMGIGFEDQGPVSGEAKAIRVRPKSPADEAGMKVDDVIISINGQPVTRVAEMKQLLGKLYAKDVIQLKIQRGAETLERSLTLTDRLLAYVTPSLGLLPDRTISDPARNGVLIRGVLPGSPAEEAGLKPGDFIERVAADGVADAADLRKRVQRFQPEDTLPLTVRRKDAVSDFAVTLVPRPSAPPDQVSFIPILQPEKPATVKIGRANEKLPGDGMSYWSFVPENYRPDVKWGLLVWLHPTGDPLESEALRVWSQVCRDRGIILVGPRTPDVSGWAPGHEESVKGIIDAVRSTYEIDPARIVLMGRESSTLFASQLAFKYRDTVRGLILQLAPLRIRPPEVDPDFPLEIAFVSSPQHAQQRQIQRTFEAVEKLNFPTWLVEQEAIDGPPFPDDVVARLALWFDILDRI